MACLSLMPFLEKSAEWNAARTKPGFDSLCATFAQLSKNGTNVRDNK